MATCKECVHVGVCRYYTNELAKANGIPLKLEEVERLLECDDCENFKARSRFVELPCKLGDEIFCTTMGKIYQGIVGRIELDDEGFAIITTDGYCVDSTICYHTQEEAEQALKERDILKEKGE